MTPYDGPLARRLWMRFEIVHDVTYFSPVAIQRAADLGLRGYWMGYFAFRSAPLGAVDPAVVAASFYGFHRTRVFRALPDAWSHTTPEEALAARLAGAEEVLRALDLGPERLREAADLAGRAAELADVAGRPLAAANQALPRPSSDAAALWLATAVLREHRGDGHVAALVSRGVEPAEAHWLKIAAGETDPESLTVSRGFPDDEWRQGRDRLSERGWIDSANTLTDAGRLEHDAIGADTDRAAAQPWAALGRGDSERLLRLLDEVARAVLATDMIPAWNPVGLPIERLLADGPG